MADGRVLGRLGCVWVDGVCLGGWSVLERMRRLMRALEDTVAGEAGESKDQCSRGYWEGRFGRLEEAV